MQIFARLFRIHRYTGFVLPLLLVCSAATWLWFSFAGVFMQEAAPQVDSLDYTLPVIVREAPLLCESPEVLGAALAARKDRRRDGNALARLGCFVALALSDKVVEVIGAQDAARQIRFHHFSDHERLITRWISYTELRN